MTDRVATLKACLHDHNGFINDRLASFVGREQELAAIRDQIAALQPSGGYVTITGQAGQGKSCVIAKLVDAYGRDRVAHHFIPFAPGPDHQVGLLRNLMAQLCLKYELPAFYVASESRLALRDYLPRVLDEIARKGAQEVIFIDGLDQLEEDASGVRDLSFLPINPPSGIVFVLGTRPNDTLKPLEVLKERWEYWLPNLARHDFDLILQQRGVTLDPPLADRFYQSMSANALYLDLVAGELTLHDTLDPEAVITHIADNPDGIFSLTIERLSRNLQQWHSVLMPLLGVLLATQQPLSKQALQNLIDTTSEIISDGLQRLGGLVQHDGQGRYSLYHLKLYNFLREDVGQPQKLCVFTLDEEMGYHEQLLRWCDRDASLDAIWEDTPDPYEQERRSYARHHYITHLALARAYEQLWQVLDAGEYGTAKLRHDPSTRSYVLDLDRARDAVIAAGGGDIAAGIALLPRLWKYSLLRCSLNSQADNLPDAMFPLMVKFGREQEAIGLIELVTDPVRKVSLLTAVAKQVAIDAPDVQQQLFTRAYAVAATIHDVQQRGNTFVDLVGEAAKQVDSVAFADMLESTWAAIEAFPYGWQTSAFTRLVKALFKAGHVDLAMNTINRAWTMTQISFDKRDLPIELAGVLVEQGQLDLASSIIKQAMTMIDALPDVEEQLRVLINLSSVLLACGDKEQAGKLLHVALPMVKNVSNPFWRASILINIMKKFIAQDDFIKARAIVDRMPQGFWRDGACRDLAEKLVAHGDFDGALKVANSIDNEQKRAEALIKLAEKLIVQGDRELAGTILTAARALIDVVTDKTERLEVLIKFARARMLQGDYESARTIIMIVKGAIEPVSYDNELQLASTRVRLVEVLIELGDFAGARATADTIGDERQQTEAFTKLVEGLIAQGDFASARTTADAMTDERGRAAALTSLADALLGCADNELSRATFMAAQTVANSIIDGKERTVALTSLAGGLFAHGDEQLSSELLVAARMVADTISDSWDRAAALAIIVEELVLQGDLDTVQAIISTIDDARKQTDSLKKLVEALIAQGNIEGAQATAETIGNHHEHSQALKKVIEALLEQGKLIEAVATAEIIPVEWGQAEVLIELAEKIPAQGNSVLVTTVLMSARKAVDAIGNGWIRVKLLGKLAEGFVQQGDRELAEEILHTAQTMIDTLPYGMDRSKAIRSIIKALVVQGDLNRTRALIESISDERDQADFLICLANCLTEQEYTEAATVSVNAALKIADSITSDWSQADKLMSVAEVFIIQGNKKAASTVLTRAQAVIDDLPTGRGRVDCLRKLSRVFNTYGDRELASDVLRVARTTARAIIDKRQRVQELVFVGLIQIIQGDLIEAQVTADMIDYDEERARVFTRLAKAYAADETTQLFNLTQHAWRSATTRHYLLQLVPLVTPLFAINAEIGTEIVQSFDWVDAMLKRQ